jgi:hypothetical protein
MRQGPRQKTETNKTQDVNKRQEQQVFRRERERERDGMKREEAGPTESE